MPSWIENGNRQQGAYPHLLCAEQPRIVIVIKQHLHRYC
jgi:hypothetical protein